MPHLVNLGKAAQIVWQSRDIVDQFPTATQLSQHNLTAAGRRTTDKYSCPADKLENFLSTLLAGGSVEDKILVSVSASKGNGNLYSVTVETQPLEYQPEAGGSSSGSSSPGGGSDSTPTPEEQEAAKNKHGSSDHPRQLSMSTQDIQVDILKTPEYAALPETIRSAIALYMRGASPETRTTISGSPKLLKDIVAQNDPLVLKAIQTPTVTSSKTVVEYSYWSLTYENYTGEFPKMLADPPFNKKLPANHVAYFLSGSNEPADGGYINKEVYQFSLPILDL